MSPGYDARVIELTPEPVAEPRPAAAAAERRPAAAALLASAAAHAVVVGLAYYEFSADARTGSAQAPPLEVEIIAGGTEEPEASLETLAAVQGAEAASPATAAEAAEPVTPAEAAEAEPPELAQAEEPAALQEPVQPTMAAAPVSEAPVQDAVQVAAEAVASAGSRAEPAVPQVTTATAAVAELGEAEAVPVRPAEETVTVDPGSEAEEAAPPQVASIRPSDGIATVGQAAAQPAVAAPADATERLETAPPPSEAASTASPEGSASLVTPTDVAAPDALSDLVEARRGQLASIRPSEAPAGEPESAPAPGTIEAIGPPIAATATLESEVSSGGEQPDTLPAVRIVPEDTPAATAPITSIAEEQSLAAVAPLDPSDIAPAGSATDASLEEAAPIPEGGPPPVTDVRQNMLTPSPTELLASGPAPQATLHPTDIVTTTSVSGGEPEVARPVGPGSGSVAPVIGDSPTATSASGAETDLAAVASTGIDIEGFDPAEGIEDTIASYGCARVNAEYRLADNGVVASGHLKSDLDRSDLLERLAALPGVSRVDPSELYVVGEPYCNVLSFFDRTGFVRSEEQRQGIREFGDPVQAGVEHLAKGEPLELSVSAPDFESFMYIDYFTADRTVVHLVPSDPSPDNRFQPKKNFMVGGSNGEGFQIWIGPPFGLDFVSAIGSSVPLFDTPRPKQESADAYLQALASEIAELKAKGEAPRLEYAYWLIYTTEEKTVSSSPPGQ
jgi:hypothetical protein